MVVLSTNLSQWGQAGLVPLTFGQLLSDIPQLLPEQVGDAFAFVKSVAGEATWNRFFANRDITTEEYVAFQLGTVLNASLHRAEALLKKCAKEHDVSDSSRKIFTELKALHDEAKRIRSGPYSA